MNEMGYINPTNDEIYVFSKVTPRQYITLLDIALRMSMYEAEELMVDRHSDTFRIICKTNQVLLMGELKDMLQGGAKLKTLEPTSDYAARVFAKMNCATQLPEEIKGLLKKL